MIENCPTPAMVKIWFERLVDENKDRVDAQQIARYGAYVGSIIDHHLLLPRAMDYARSSAQKTAEAGNSYASGTVILADQMSQSKGRFQRVWHAPQGGIWGCLVTVNTLLPESSRFVPFAVGLACCETMRNLGCDGARLRWVNDVLVDEKKVAGFLVESYHEPFSKEEFILTGFGINVNNENFPSEISSNAASLSKLLHRRLDVADVTAQFIARLSWYFGLLHYEEAQKLRDGNFSGHNGRHLLLEKWLLNSDTIGQKVWYGFDVMESPQYKAQVKAVNDDGGLVMYLEDGYEKTEYSGEIRYLTKF